MSTRLSRRARLVLECADAGLTLIEVVVAMVLSVILGGLTVMVFANTNTSSAATTDRTISTASARDTIQAWAGYLRVADGTTPGSRSNRIEWLTGNDMLFYADLRNRTMSSPATIGAATMIWIRLDSQGRLVEEQFASTAAQNASPTMCRQLALSVSNSIGTDPVTGQQVTVPLFTPGDYNGTQIASGTDLGSAPAASAGCQKLPVTVPSQAGHPDAAAQANLVNVFSVALDFTVKDTKGLHPIEFTSEAFLPSLGGV